MISRKDQWLLAGGLLLTCTAFAVGLANSPTQPREPQTFSRPVPAQLGNTPSVHFLNCVYLAGQPSADDFVVARKSGIKTVVDLRNPGELGWDEGAFVRKLGMEYHRIPFSAPESLTADVFSQVRALLNDWKNRPLILHCRSANRVGAVWLAHRVLDAGLPYDQALDEARQIGLRTVEYERQAKAYIKKAQMHSMMKLKLFPSSSVTHVTEKNFVEEVLQSGQPVVVDFYAPWCMPCKMISPVLEQLAREFRGGVKVVKVNVDEAQDLTAKYSVDSVPTLLFFRNGVVEDQLVGAPSADVLHHRVARLASVCSAVAANVGR